MGAGGLRRGRGDGGGRTSGAAASWRQDGNGATRLLGRPMAAHGSVKRRLSDPADARRSLAADRARRIGDRSGVSPPAARSATSAAPVPPRAPAAPGAAPPAPPGCAPAPATSPPTGDPVACSKYLKGPEALDNTWLLTLLFANFHCLLVGLAGEAGGMTRGNPARGRCCGWLFCTLAARRRRGETAPYVSGPAPLDAPLQRGRTG